MDGLKKIGRFIRNCVELYIPIVAFVALFLIFCFQVFMRYIVNNPQSWTLEVEQMCFLWLVLLGACFAQREKAHVSFTLLYDILDVKGKAITAMLGNLLIAVTFAVAFIPSLRYIWGLMSRAQVTSILKIPKTLVFFPYVIFLGFILVYSLLDIYEEIRVLQGDQRYINKMLNEGKTEAEQAVEDAIQQENGEAKKEEQ
ncbi:TRAP transporter small permease [Oscillibacter sp.]|uniref:TRAP transporter small permease n=1 Tax=Oscillibacter sp. TaxID=1945593 RepID=UPI00289B97C6|nr:TRAP transporter small permease [Oscillibacter sp.]